MSGDDINEATAALKGMLGIGGAASDSSARVSPNTQSTKSQVPAQESTSRTTSTKKKPKKKKGKQQNQQQQPPKTGKQRPNSRPKAKKQTEAKPKKTENFAWSAFQSSPDASALPIPAFVSPATEKQPLVVPDTDALPSVLLSSASSEHKPSSSESPTEELLKTSTIEDVADKVQQPSKKEVDETDSKGPADTGSEEAAPVSESGINLAALAASPPSKPEELQKQNLTSAAHGVPSSSSSSPPRSQLPPLPTAAATVPSANAAPLNSAQQQFSSSQHPTQQYYPYSHLQQQSQFSRLPPPPPPHHQPPPGYITIHIQVPPTLMPGRQMVVASPAGYPVRVVVPDGIPPGAVIPVHVPAPHPMMGQYHQYAAGPRMPQSMPPPPPPKQPQH